MDLDVFKQNILNWYPFEKENSVLEIGAGEGQVTKAIANSCKRVVALETNSSKNKALTKIVSDFSNIEIVNQTLKEFKSNEKFDYITLIGIEERVEELVGENLKLVGIIKILEKYLKPNGKILLAVDNKFGLRFFAGDPENILNKKFVSLNGYNNETKKIETFTKSRLERILHDQGYKTFFYYPLPDYKQPAVIFSDNHYPSYTSIDKYYPYHTDNSTIIMNEIDVFREILKNNEEMFTFFANSFLVEISKENIKSEFQYVSFNNIRKPEYQLITKIADTYVEKQMVSEKALNHYENIKNNLEILKQNNIESVDYIEDGVIKSKFIEQKYLLNKVLAQKLEDEEFDGFYKIVDDYIKIISKGSYQETDYDKTVFGDYKIEVDDKSIINEMHFLNNGLWDMTFKNCFFVDNKFLFFDQEWNKQNLPYEYTLYRSIFYTISLRRFIKIEELYEKYGLIKFIDIFKKLDDAIQEEIRNDEVWKYYGQDKFINIDGTKQELINVNIRSKAMQGAIDNLQKENEELRKEVEKYRKRPVYKIYRKIKNILKLPGGKNE